MGENRRFERVAENLPVGSEIFKLEAHPRSEFKIEPIDNSLSDVNYFKYVNIDDKFVAIKLNQSLEDLVDRVSFFLSLSLPLFALLRRKEGFPTKEPSLVHLRKGKNNSKR